MVRRLTDAGEQPLEIAQALADWLGEARKSLELAQYDFHLALDTAAVVSAAIREASARGVAVRIIYNVDHRNPIPVPPPPEPDVQLIESLGVPSKAVGGVPDLMHHKFVVRDRQTVWTGSMNWTDDSWSRQENVILSVGSPELAEAFVEDFDQLWAKDVVEETGFVAPKRLHVDGLLVRAWFTPGYGEDLSARIARQIARAKRRGGGGAPRLTPAAPPSPLAQAVPPRAPPARRGPGSAPSARRRRA